MNVVAVLAPGDRAGASGAPPTAPRVRVLLIDERLEIGSWNGCPDDHHLTLEQGGVRKLIPMDDIGRVVLREPGTRGRVSTWLHPVGGGRLPAELVGPAVDGVVATTPWGREWAFPFSSLSAVQFAEAAEYPASAELFNRAMAERLPGQDVLISRHHRQPKVIRGLVKRLGNRDGTFSQDGRERTFDFENVFAVVMASGVNPKPPPPWLITMSDGASFGAHLEQCSAESVTIRTALDRTVTLPVADLATIDVRNPRVVFLDELSILSETSEGRLHPPWPVRAKQSVGAAPIRMAGRTYARGLGVHSRTLLTYALDGAFETFVSTVGIDDSVRPLGAVTFEILGDGQSLVATGLLTGRDEPFVLRADVRGIKQLTLIVDYGDTLDLADHADWAGARLIRPAADSIGEVPGERG